MDAREKTWHGLRAALLSIVAGVGHLYLGEKRGYVVFFFGMLLLLISRVFWRPAELLYISLAIFSAVDAYSIAKRGHGLM
jgi:nucleoside recognition membrane protein YjiH